MNQHQHPVFACLLMTVGLFLVACAAESPAPAAVTPAPTAAPATDDGPSGSDTIMVSSDNGLMRNENVRRNPLFNTNTLAYELPRMEHVEVVNLTYAHYEGDPLTMDVYYPAGTAADDARPVVVFGLGYRMSRLPLRNEHFYTSWGRLVAAAGMVGVTYDTEQPDQDLTVVMAFIRANAAALRVDADRIGLMSSSANVPTVMSYLMQPGRQGIRFGIYYYGLSLTPDRRYAERFSRNCVDRGCLVAELADVTYVDPQIPLFVVKAGQDFIQHINEGMDHFVAYARAGGATVTVVDHEAGKHGFDTQQRNEESAQIIADTVTFMRSSFGLDGPAEVVVPQLP